MGIDFLNLGEDDYWRHIKMALDFKITQLDAAASLGVGDLFEIVQGGQNKKLSGTNLFASIGSAAITLTNKIIDANGVGNAISNLETNDFAVNVIDTDITLTANSDTRIATQKAIKAYVDNAVPAAIEDNLTISTPGQTVFTLSGTPSSNANFTLYLNGQLRLRGVDYTQAGTTLTWLDPGSLTLLTTDELLAQFNVAPSVPGSLYSVFGRTGVVIATLSDYDASQIDNDSSVSGSTVKDALNQLNIWNDNGTDITPVNAGRNINIGTGGLKDNDTTTALPLGDVGNIGLDSSFYASSIVGSINENKTKETFIMKAFGDSPYSAVAGNNAIAVNTSGGAVSIVLPAANLNIGARIRVSKITSDTNQVIINTTGGDTVGFQSQWTLSNQGDSLTAISDGVSEWCLFTERHATGVATFQVDHDSNLGTHRVQNIGTAANFNLEFTTPPDFLSLISLDVIGVPNSAGAAGTGKDIDLNSNYGTLGEVYNQHSESDTTSTYDTGTVDQFFALDLSSVFTNLSANDQCGVNINHNIIGGTISYFEIRLHYIKKG